MASLAWAAGDALVLIDPLVPDEAWPELDAHVERHGRAVGVLITVFWHSRSADAVRERYGARVWAHRPALERIECTVTDPFDIGAELPGGAVGYDVERADEVVYWLPGPAAIVAGDVLLGRPGGIELCPPSWLGGEEGRERSRGAGDVLLGRPGGIELVPPSWLGGEAGRERSRASLRRLLELPVEMLLVSHGEPVCSGGRGALEKALAG